MLFIECTSHGEDKSAINWQLIVSLAKMFVDYFLPTLRHNSIVFILFEGRSLPSKFQLKPVRSFILLFIAVYIDSFMMIGIERSETTQKIHWMSETN